MPALDPSTGAGLVTLSRNLDPIAIQSQLRQQGVPDPQIVEVLAALVWMRQIAISGTGRRGGQP